LGKRGESEWEGWKEKIEHVFTLVVFHSVLACTADKYVSRKHELLRISGYLKSQKGGKGMIKVRLHARNRDGNFKKSFVPRDINNNLYVIRHHSQMCFPDRRLIRLNRLNRLNRFTQNTRAGLG
jgi:hypothetical protein